MEIILKKKKYKYKFMHDYQIINVNSFSPYSFLGDSILFFFLLCIIGGIFWIQNKTCETLFLANDDYMT